MERHFVLPIAFAAAFHTSLLFSFNGHSVDHAAPVSKPVVPPSPDPVPIVLEPPPTDPEATAKPKGSPIPPPPSQPDRPELAPPDRIAIEVPGHPATLHPDVHVISPGTGDVLGELGVSGPSLLRSIDLDNPPHARVQGAPTYPFDAKRTGLGGEVTVEFMVDEGGYVREPRVTHSTDRVFEESAVRAVARWRFEPGKRAGQIVRFRMAVPIVFSLQDN